MRTKKINSSRAAASGRSPRSALGITVTLLVGITSAPAASQQTGCLPRFGASSFGTGKFSTGNNPCAAVGNALTILPATLPGGKVGVAFPTHALAATGGVAPYSFSVTAGTLPVGLELTGAGVLRGTPAQTGNFGFTITATDSTLPASGGPLSGSQSYVGAFAKGDQIISFALIGDRAITSEPFALIATATSSLPVSFASMTTSTCTVIGSTVTLRALGPCMIRASQAGDADWNAANDVDQSFMVRSSIDAGAIPTTSEWGLLAMASLLALAGFELSRRQVS